MKSCDILFAVVKNTGRVAGNSIYRNEQGLKAPEDIRSLIDSIISDFDGTAIQVTTDEQASETVIAVSPCIRINGQLRVYRLLHI